MPAGLIRFPAFSPAARGLLASCWKARKAPYRQILDVPFTRQYSSIADAMLGRATKQFEGTNSKNDLAKQLFPSSSPAQNGNIEEQFKKAKQSSQSIGGFTGGYTNRNTSNPLHTRSPNIKRSIKPKSSGFAASTAPTSLASVFSKQDSFQNTADVPIDLTQGDDPIVSKPPPSSHVQFDENDFDDDADLDLDMDYELPMSMAAPPKPSSQKVPTPSPFNLPNLKRSMQPPISSQNPASSAVTWSSSSPSHKATPPGALKRRQQEDIAAKEPTPLVVTDPNPRPAKRRTLPWVQKKAEDDQIRAMKEEEEDAVAVASSGSSSHKLLCFKCKKEGHSSKECPNIANGKGSAWDFTPLPKDKDKPMPWNSTGSAVQDEKKKFRERQKAAKEAAAEARQAYQSKKKVAMAPITLSQEQQRVLELVVGQGKSVFFTGSAGTGKSVLMRAIIAELRKKHLREPDRVAVTASTGLAACNIGGVTLHSFGGIGLGKEDVPALVKKIKRNQKAKNRWLRTKILVIDEISMVDGDLFDKLEGIARAMRNNGRPFGGIQLVITGDFFQLPPVPDYDNKVKGVKFAFDAGTWSTAIHHTIGLTEVFRQKDPVFANMLNEMRLGKITDDTVKAFKKLSRKLEYHAQLEATELFPTRNEVENSNSFKMRGLQGKSYRYEARDTGTITDIPMRDKLLSNMMAPKTLELKKGAQVMLIKNMDDGLVNGSLGKVIAFMSEKTFDIYENNPEMFDDSIPKENVDDDSGLPNGRNLAKSSSSKSSVTDAGSEYPLVRFAIADGTSRDLLVQPEEWKIELPNGEVQAQRSQLPLILAWALSIHKAQGQTLECVKIDLKRIFEKGQAYVALSRATSQEGLEVQNFDKNKVMAHPRVAQFYNSLYSVNKALQHPKVAKAAPTKKAKTYEEEFLKPEVSQARGYSFDDDEEEAMAAYG